VILFLDGPPASGWNDVNLPQLSRAPIWLSQRRSGRRKSHRGCSSNSDWRFGHELAPGQHRPSATESRPISYGRLRICSWNRAAVFFTEARQRCWH